MRVDAGAYLGAWPFRPLEGTPGRLQAMMRQMDLTHAVVSPLNGLFHASPEEANRVLLRRLRGRANLWGAPVVNLGLADAADQIAALALDPRVRAVRLAPGFHAYPVSELRPALALLAELGLTAVIQLRLQDERSQPRISFVSPVAIAEAIAAAAATPAARVVLAAARSGEIAAQAEAIRARAGLWLEISHLDGVDCLQQACGAVGAERLLFSTCWPFFYARAARLKVEGAGLSPEDQARVMGGNVVDAFALPVG